MTLNLAAIAALFAAVALVVYAAANSDRAQPPPLMRSGGEELRLALTRQERRAIFVEVIAEHRAGSGGPEARRLVAERRSLSTETVARIAREGVSRGWPRE